MHRSAVHDYLHSIPGPLSPLEYRHQQLFAQPSRLNNQPLSFLITTPPPKKIKNRRQRERERERVDIIEVINSPQLVSTGKLRHSYFGLEKKISKYATRIIIHRTKGRETTPCGDCKLCWTMTYNSKLVLTVR